MKYFLGIVLVSCLLLSGCGTQDTDSSAENLPPVSGSVSKSSGQESAAGSDVQNNVFLYTATLPGTYDLNGDGTAETLELADDGQICTLLVRDLAGQELHRMENLHNSKFGAGSLFACRVGERDSLLRYYHSISNGWGVYDFEVFSLDDSGEKQILDEGSISFDVMCGSPQFSGKFDEDRIAAFLDRVHGYLEQSTLIFSLQTGAEERGQSGEFYSGDDFTEQSGTDWRTKLRAYREETEAEWREILGTAERLPGEYDFDHDGQADVVELITHGEGGGAWLELKISRPDGTLLWSKEGSYAHAGWVNVFAYEEDGKDYILDYMPGMWQGSAGYSYRMVSFNRQGEEVLLREDSVKFDLNFGMSAPYHESFDADAVGAFLDEIHGYLEKSVCLLSTSDSNVTTGSSGANYRDPVFDDLYNMYEQEGSWAERLRDLERMQKK